MAGMTRGPGCDPPDMSPCLVAAAALLAGGLTACAGGTIPKQYLMQADTNVTLTQLSKRPEAYQGQVVILGGVIAMQQEVDNSLWLWVKNRPLDVDYVPHIPVTNEGPEAGHYWVVVESGSVPPGHQDWARLTVVGRVIGRQTGTQGQTTGEEVVLSAIYLKGWDRRLGGYGIRETDDSGGAGSAAGPRGVLKNSGQ